jgi:hypothetical protein
MSSINQINANRANAASSTGPTSDAGKEACKYNATSHGLTGKQIVIKGEDPAEYDALSASLLADIKPVGPRETGLAVVIIQDQWRLQRAKRTEAEVLNKYGALECITDPEARKAFNTITRYLASIERSWRKACTELEKLQKARKEEAAARMMAEFQAKVAQAKSSNSAMAPANAAPIGSVSQNRHPNEDLPLSCRL